MLGYTSKMKMFRDVLRTVVVLGLVPIVTVQPSLAWGVDGHHMINRLAGSTLPADVPAFLRSPEALEALSFYAPLPDHWRGQGEPELAKATAPEHFIQFETVDAIFTTLPRNRYDYVRALAAAQTSHPEMVLTAEKVGLQPYQATEVWERLKVGMRDYHELVADKQDTKQVETEIIFLSGWLGHYVGDGSMPLHTSNKPNGWIGPNPNGYTTEHHIHGLFESEFVKANVKLADVAPLVEAKPLVIDDVFEQYVAYLKHTHSFVEKTYQLDKVGGFTGAGTPEGKALVDQQLAAAATELRDLIYTAWIKSGDPVPQRH
jgi:hypothetical protein